MGLRVWQFLEMATNSLTLLPSRDKVCVPFLWIWAGVGITALAKRVQGLPKLDCKRPCRFHLVNWDTGWPLKLPGWRSLIWHSDPQSPLSLDVQPSSPFTRHVGEGVLDPADEPIYQLNTPRRSLLILRGIAKPFSKSRYTNLRDIIRRAIVLNSKFQDGLLHSNK